MIASKVHSILLCYALWWIWNTMVNQSQRLLKSQQKNADKFTCISIYPCIVSVSSFIMSMPSTNAVGLPLLSTWMLFCCKQAQIKHYMILKYKTWPLKYVFRRRKLIWLYWRHIVNRRTCVDYQYFFNHSWLYSAVKFISCMLNT